MTLLFAPAGRDFRPSADSGRLCFWRSLVLNKKTNRRR